MIETHPYELLPLQPVDSGLALPAQQTPRGQPSLHDAILLGLVTPLDPDRRRLVVAIAQGIDTRSITSVQSLERVARRTDTVLHVVSVQPPSRDAGGVFPDGTQRRGVDPAGVRTRAGYFGTVR